MRLAVARLPWSYIARAGTVAGIAGGILIDAFIYITSLAPHHQSIVGLWQFVASTALGKAAFTSPLYAWAGAAMHALVSIAWGIGFAYLAITRPQVPSHPILSGVVFGLVVYVVMQLVLFSVQALRITTGTQIIEGLIAHCVFFGLPVSLIVRLQLGR